MSIYFGLVIASRDERVAHNPFFSHGMFAEQSAKLFKYLANFGRVGARVDGIQHELEHIIVLFQDSRDFHRRSPAVCGAAGRASEAGFRCGLPPKLTHRGCLASDQRIQARPCTVTSVQTISFSSKFTRYSPYLATQC